MKKLLFTLLTTVFALNISAQELQGKCGDNATWQLVLDINTKSYILEINGTGKISDYDEKTTAPWNALYWNDYVLMDISYGPSIGKVIIGNKITHIGSYCFTSSNKKLTTIDLSNATSLTSIGDNAFNGCPITTIDLSNATSLTSIGSNAFKGCNKLTEIKIPESVTTFGTEVFFGCSSLTKPCEHIMIKADLTKLEEDGTYTISDNVKYIEKGAFDVFQNSEIGLNYLIYQGCPKVGGDIATSQIMNNITTTSVPSKDYNSFNVDKNGFSSYGNNVNTTKIEFLDNKYKSYTFLHDVSIPSGVAAYTAKAEGDAITLTKIKSGKVKAGEGILLKAEANGTYTFGNGIEAEDINENENHLVGVLKETSLDNGDNAYVLKTDKNDNIQKFYKIVSRIKIGKFKAYLSAGESQAKTFSIFNDDTTNIEETEQKKEDPINSRTDIYNMSGQKLSTTQKGLNIVNGKIVIK